jgi:glycerol-3-phosphate dehydrogenase
VFALPWRGGILLGTTETPYQGTPDSVMPLRQEEDYLLETLARYFPACRSGAKPVGRFAGLRVLPRDVRRPHVRARDTRLALLGDGAPLLSLYGGKLTAYRATAEKAMATLAPFLPACRPRADTRTLRLSPVA